MCSILWRFWSIDGFQPNNLGYNQIAYMFMNNKGIQGQGCDHAKSI